MGIIIPVQSKRRGEKDNEGLLHISTTEFSPSDAV